MITYGGCSLDETKSHWRKIANGTFKPMELITVIDDPTRERFDDLVPRELLATAYIQESLDVPGAVQAAICMA
ncbi:MAG: hypothetical protein B7Z55_15155 [Planctomycetales bacterium 12-60-4]|nr:MAG: hypothetical protein B7Z55_15155 [Planctomycetales bacterium 12-60-4]